MTLLLSSRSFPEATQMEERLFAYSHTCFASRTPSPCGQNFDGTWRRRAGVSKTAASSWWSWQMKWPTVSRTVWPLSSTRRVLWKSKILHFKNSLICSLCSLEVSLCGAAATLILQLLRMLAWSRRSSVDGNKSDPPGMTREVSLFDSCGLAFTTRMITATATSAWTCMSRFATQHPHPHSPRCSTQVIVILCSACWRSKCESSFSGVLCVLMVPTLLVTLISSWWIHNNKRK